MIKVFSTYGCLLFLLTQPAFSQQVSTPPEPEVLAQQSNEASLDLPDLLTLEQALKLASGTHPDLRSAEAKMASANVLLQQTAVKKGWKANLNLQGRYADRGNDGSSDFSDDSRYELQISRLLSDFGQTAATATAAQLSIDSNALNLAYAKRLRRIDIMARYLDVVAADYKFAADNESMTLAFFPWNRALERRERFDSESELTVLRLQSAYQKELRKRNRTQQNQRLSRFRLASALGWPDAKPASVIEPNLSAYARPLPDYDELLILAIDKSPVLARLKLEKEALNAKAEAASRRLRPELSVNLYASKFERDYTSKDDARAVLSLQIPLFDGGAQKTAIAGSGAALLAKEAEVSRYQYELRTQILTWAQRLETLQETITANEIELNYRERSLDRARLLYEMEVSVRIGQAMSDMAEAIYQTAIAHFERAIIWEQIDALLGAPVTEKQP